MATIAARDGQSMLGSGTELGWPQSIPVDDTKVNGANDTWFPTEIVVGIAAVPPCKLKKNVGCNVVPDGFPMGLEGSNVMFMKVKLNRSEGARTRPRN